MRKLNLLLGLFICIAFVSCGKKFKTNANDIQETAQQVGDVMASIDESAGSTGTFAMLEDSHQKLFARYGQKLIRTNIIEQFTPLSAQATLCLFANTFGSCNAGQIVRNFGDCAIGAGTFAGTVTLTWANGTQCALNTLNDSITRVPNFTATGTSGGTLTVTKSGTIGQRLTWVSGPNTNRVFSFTNDGIRRVIAFNGQTLFDFTTQTTSPITVTGNSRANRTINGGSLQVKHNLAGTTCDYVPTNLAWSSTCNCPVSGSWTTTCSNGKSSTISLNGCGTANFTLGTDSQAVVFDRCYGY